MFDNIGGKIKTLAQVMCWAGIILSIFCVIPFMAHGMVLSGVMFMVIGSLISWVSSFTLYGFGELIENSHITNTNTYEIHKLLTRIYSEEGEQVVKENNTSHFSSEINPTIKEEPVKENNTSYFSSILTPTIKKNPDGSWTCKKCNTKNGSNSLFCKDCGTYK